MILANAEVWALATAVIGTAALVIEHLRNRSPSQEVRERLDALERRMSALESWRNG